MAIADKIPMFIDMAKKNKDVLHHNEKLLDIFGGNLLKHVDDALVRQLKGQSYEQARMRIPPINVLKRIIDKQAKIYAQGVTRQVIDGNSTTDPQVLAWYEKVMLPTRKFQLANQYFNMFKNALIYPYLRDDLTPSLRIIPSDRFIPYSTGDDDDCIGGVLLIMGTAKSKRTNRVVTVYQAIEKDEFVFFTSESVNITAERAPKQPDGIHGLGRLPFVYVNRDPNNVMPTADSDLYAMTILIPVLLTDINFAHMFQAFSIMYGINVTDNGLSFGPNAFWSFKTEPGSDQKPEIGTIKPNADITAGLELVANQFALWLNTRGIKPGSVGQVAGTNFQSGISKILDEMDTSEDRNEQVPYFEDAESEVWDLIVHTLHPIWITRGIEMKERFSTSASIKANFAEQIPLVRRGQTVDEQKNEVAYGFTTSERAIRRINPQMTDDEIAALIAEIKVEKALNAAAGAALAADDAKIPPEPKDQNAKFEQVAV